MSFSDGIVTLQHLLRNHSEIVIFDVGAHVGATTANYMEAFPDATIYAFEPDPYSFAQLQGHFAGSPRVRAYNLAISEHSGDAGFFLNQYAPTYSLLERPKDGVRYYPPYAGPKGVTKVKTSTVDEEASSAGLSRISILKMDIQGAELIALRGAWNILATGSVDLLYLEIAFVPLYEWGVPFLKILDFLTGFCYFLFSLYDFQHTEHSQLKFADALFVSPGTL